MVGLNPTLRHWCELHIQCIGVGLMICAPPVKRFAAAWPAVWNTQWHAEGPTEAESAAHRWSWAKLSLVYLWRS